MEIQRLVTGAKLGDNADFSALVRLYQHRLLATVDAMVRNRTVAEDLVQEAFVRAWSGLASLQSAEAFPSWLWAIARNLARTQCQRQTKEGNRCAEDELENQPDPRSWEVSFFGETGPGWGRLTATMSGEQRLLVELRHGAGLSLRQIGAVLGVAEKTVKSRLFTVRQKLRKALDQDWSRDRPVFLEEKIMDKIESLRLGAHVFERLSLAAQSHFTLAVLAEKEVPESVLAEIGKVDRGAEFLALYGTKTTLAELVNVLNHVDRFTECRLVEHLEVVAPSQAETLKRNFFVFEDVVLFDASAVRQLYREADRDLLVMAVGNTELRVRRHVLDALDPADRPGFEARIGQVDGDRKLVRAAQELVVNTIKDLERTGRLVVRWPEGGSSGQASFSAGA